MKKVLVIVDEAFYSELLITKLKEKGYQVLTSKNGTEGLQIAFSRKPDLILLDVALPKGMDSLAILHALRKNKYGKSANVIILTDIEPDKSTVNKIVQEMPLYYCVKSDTDVEALLEKITHLLTDTISKKK